MAEARPTDIHGDVWARAWSLTHADTAFIDQRTPASRLDYAVKIAFYRQHGRFPTKGESLSGPSLDYLADQVGTASSQWIKPKIRTEQRRNGLPPEKWSGLKVRVFGYFALEGARYGEETLHTRTDHREAARG